MTADFTGLLGGSVMTNGKNRREFRLVVWVLVISIQVAQGGVPPYNTCEETTRCESTTGSCGCTIGGGTNCGCLWNPGCTDPPYNRACTGPKTSQAPCHTQANQYCCTRIKGCRQGNPDEPCQWYGGVCGQPASYCITETELAYSRTA